MDPIFFKHSSSHSFFLIVRQESRFTLGNGAVAPKHSQPLVEKMIKLESRRLSGSNSQNLSTSTCSLRSTYHTTPHVTNTRIILGQIACHSVHATGTTLFKDMTYTPHFFL